MINEETGIINFNKINDINIENERSFWYKFLLIAVITVPITCPLWNRNSINLYNNDTLNNPVIARCCWSKCRKTIFLREKKFLAHFPWTPVSIVFKIIYLWIFEKKNGNDITNTINGELINYHVSKIIVLDVLKIARYYIANYYKHVYKIEDISEANKNDRFSIDESEFVNISNQPIWVIGIINNLTKNFLLEISKRRNEEVLKKIVTAHVKSGNTIVSDGWSGYNFLSRPDSQYTHSIHNHAHGDFGVGLDSTSHIEQLWSKMKTIIKQIYYIIPTENFFLFIWEAEFRIKIKNYNTQSKMNDL